MFGISLLFHQTAFLQLVQRSMVTSRRKLLQTIFSELSTNLLMQELQGQAMCSQLLVCLEGPLVAVVMEPLPVIFRSLNQLRCNDRQLARVVDRVAAVRCARMESSSLRSYASHLRMIAWECRVFGIDPCRPDMLGIRRIAACVNNYYTLAGWLSAWKAALEALGQPWKGDNDPVLRGIRRGTRRSQLPRMPRQRVRRRLLRRLLVCAIQKHAPGWPWWASLGIIAHSFAPRMPSELFAQFSFDTLRQRYEGWEYGPIKRKMRLDFQFVKSFCFCPSDPLLCLCSWHRIWPELNHSKHLGGFNATKWTAGLQALLKELGVPNALDFHGHDIRRGAAIDIFSERGVAAMLQHCNWRSLGSANPYVPSDEIQAGLITHGFADESEPDS